MFDDPSGHMRSGANTMSMCPSHIYYDPSLVRNNPFDSFKYSDSYVYLQNALSAAKLNMKYDYCSNDDTMEETDSDRPHFELYIKEMLYCILNSYNRQTGINDPINSNILDFLFGNINTICDNLPLQGVGVTIAYPTYKSVSIGNEAMPYCAVYYETLTYGLVYDMYGNYSITKTTGRGQGIPDVSVSTYFSVIGTNNMNDIAGEGTAVGGSVQVPAVPISAGVEHSASEDGSIHGFTLSIGLGVFPIVLYSIGTQTTIIDSGNFYDDAYEFLYE